MRTIRYMLSGTPRNIHDAVHKARREELGIDVYIEDTSEVAGFSWLQGFKRSHGVGVRVGNSRISLNNFCQRSHTLLPNFDVTKDAIRYAIGVAERLEDLGLGVTIKGRYSVEEARMAFEGIDEGIDRVYNGQASEMEGVIKDALGI